MQEDSSRKRYYLTGATGFIGNRLARLLMKEGNEIVVLARAPHKARDLKSLGATIVQGDVTARDTLHKGMDGVDGVFHLAANYTFGRRNTGMMEAVNVGGTRNVLTTMRDLHIPKGVFTSSTVVFSDTRGLTVDENYFFEGTHMSEYARTKWMAHYDVAKTMIFDGLPLVILQPSTVYGPGDQSAIAHTFLDYLRRRLPVLPKDTSFSWAHVDDVARGHYRAMMVGQTGESYILGGPAHTLIEAMQVASRITRKRPPPIHLGPDIMRAAATVLNVLESIIDLPPHWTAEAIRMTAGCTYTVSSEKAERELQYEARSLHRGLKGTLTDLAARIATGQNRGNDK